MRVCVLVCVSASNNRVGEGHWLSGVVGDTPSVESDRVQVAASDSTVQWALATLLVEVCIPRLSVDNGLTG